MESGAIYQSFLPAEREAHRAQGPPRLHRLTPYRAGRKNPLRLRQGILSVLCRKGRLPWLAMPRQGRQAPAKKRGTKNPMISLATTIQSPPFRDLKVQVNQGQQGCAEPYCPTANAQVHTLTSGTFGTVPRRGGSPPPGPPGPGGFFRGEELRLALARRGTGSFSGRGFTGPSGYSKFSLLLPASSVTTT